MLFDKKLLLQHIQNQNINEGGVAPPRKPAEPKPKISTVGPVPAADLSDQSEQQAPELLPQNPKSDGGPPPNYSGPSIGADPDAERFEAQGIEPNTPQMDRAMASATKNRNQYGSPAPSFGQMVTQNTKTADQLQGGQGLLQAAQDATMTAGVVALKPIVAASKIGQAGAAVANAPGLRQVTRVAKAVDPNIGRVAAGNPASGIGSRIGSDASSAMLDTSIGERGVADKTVGVARKISMSPGAKSRVASVGWRLFGQ
tara:strand:+ start:1665 stop:2435 length:771 start_codon:yes stop_codon:yes gene_type:complete